MPLPRHPSEHGGTAPPRVANGAEVAEFNQPAPRIGESDTMPAKLLAQTVGAHERRIRPLVRSQEGQQEKGILIIDKAINFIQRKSRAMLTEAI